MSLSWPHRLRIFDAGSGGTPGGFTDDDGIWHDDPAVDDSTTLYDGDADVQDGGKMFSKDRSGEIVDQSDAVAFLRSQKVAKTLANKVNLKAVITWEDGTTSSADVVKVRRLDGTVWLKRVY